MRALALALLLSLAAPPSAHAGALRRFALVAGNDAGGADTRPLLYARADARKMHELLARLGGVAERDARLLLDAGAQDFLGALSELEAEAARARARGERTALLVYYSGHAKDGALRLGETRVGFESLKRRLAEGPADIRIAIFDSCRSGALTRTKGVRRAPAFDIESGPARAAQGLVILTSSAADEDSQESDALRGSYFSHHLASGLLGDADRTGDGQVTLFEAYSYAYERTVADTADSAAGPQHPTFSYDLAGNGDLVLTDLGARAEGLLVPAPAPAGPYFFVDRRGAVVAEVLKATGAERRVALAPGTYRVKRRLADRLRVGEVEVRRGEVARLDEGRLRDAPFSDDPVKGASRGPRWSAGLSGGYQAFFDGATRARLFPSTPLAGAEALLRDYFRSDWWWGFDAAAGDARATLALEGLPPLGYRYRAVTLGTSLLSAWPLGDTTPFAGARLALLTVSRDFDAPGLPTQHYGVLSPGLVLGVEQRLWGPWHLSARGRVHYLLYNVDESRSLGYWELAALITHEL